MKLSSKKNLIFAVIVVMIGIFFMPHNVYAESVSEYLKATVAGVYQIIQYGCIFVLFAVLMAGFINRFLSGTPSASYLLRRELKYIGITLFILIFLTTIISVAISMNERIVNSCRDMAYSLSGVNANSNSDEYDETTLFETTISKAYEIKASSGFVGMFMYIILVVYTVRFVIIYIRRYLIVLILILVGPILFTQNAILKTFSGKSGKVKLWVKEMIFNIYIQVLHAFAYSALIGFTIRFSDTALSFIGVILTLIVFGFMSSIEKVIRQIFNFIGGSESVKSTGSSIANFAKNPKESMASLAQSAKDLPNSLKKSAISFKNNAGVYMSDIKSNLKGDNIKVTAEEVAKEQKRMDESVLGKVEKAVKGAGRKAVDTGKSIKNGAKEFKNGVKDLTLQELNLARDFVRDQKVKVRQDAEAAKRVARLFKYYGKRREIIEKVQNGTATEKEIELATEFDDEDTLNGDIDKMKNGIMNSGNLVATIYRLKGPAPFIRSIELNGGFPTVGMTMLKSSIDLERLLNGNLQEGDLKKHRKTITLKAPNNKPVKQVEMTVEDPGTDGAITKENNKRFTFKEFSPGAVRTITNQVMLQTLLSDGRAFSLLKVKRKMESTEGVVPTGRVKMKNAGTEERTGAEEHQTFKSSVTREDLNNMEVRSAERFKLYLERAKDNKWAQYVSANKATRKVIDKMFGTNQDEQSQANREGEGFYKNLEEMTWEEKRKAFNDYKQEQRVNGYIVATAMQYNRALETVNLQSDVDFQKTLMDNLTKHGILPKENKMTKDQRTEILESLQEQISLLTTDDKDTYYKLIVDLTEEAQRQNRYALNNEVRAGQSDGATGRATGSVDGKNAGVKFGENVQNGAQAGEQGGDNGQGKANSQGKGHTENSGQQSENSEATQNVDVEGKTVKGTKATDFSEFVEEVTHEDYHEQVSEYHTEKFENVVDKIFDEGGFMNTVAKTAFEMTGEEARLYVEEKKEDLKKLADELVIDSGKEFWDNDFVGAFKETGRAINEFDPKERVKEGVKNTVDGAKQGVKNTVGAATGAVVDTVTGAGQAVKDKVSEAVDDFVHPFRDRSRGGKSTEGGENVDELFVYFVYFDNAYQGKFTLPKLESNKRYTIRYALERAGYNIDFIDLTKIDIDAYAKDGMPIWIYSKSNSVDDETEETDEEIFVRYEKTIKKVIREYVEETKITSAEALKKTMHKKSVILRAEKKLKDEQINRDQIEKIIDRCIKELEVGEKFFSMSLDAREKERKIYQEAQKNEQARKSAETRAKQAANQAEAEAIVNSALQELTDKKAAYTDSQESGSSRSTVRKAREMYMENDALNSNNGGEK